MRYLSVFLLFSLLSIVGCGFAANPRGDGNGFAMPWQQQSLNGPPIQLVDSTTFQPIRNAEVEFTYSPGQTSPIRIGMDPNLRVERFTARTDRNGIVKVDARAAQQQMRIKSKNYLEFDLVPDSTTNGYAVLYRDTAAVVGNVDGMTQIALNQGRSDDKRISLGTRSLNAQPNQWAQ